MLVCSAESVVPVVADVLLFSECGVIAEVDILGNLGQDSLTEAKNLILKSPH